MKGYWHSFTFYGLTWRQFLDIGSLIFNNRKLQRKADLRSGQAHAGCVSHRFAHEPDKTLHLVRQYLVVRQPSRALPQDRFTDLADLKLQVFIITSDFSPEIQDNTGEFVGTF